MVGIFREHCNLELVCQRKLPNQLNSANTHWWSEKDSREKDVPYYDSTHRLLTRYNAHVSINIDYLHLRQLF
jgi:hypothetical protein